MKLIIFTRQDNIEVKFKTSLKDVNDLDENFVISDIKLNTFLEQSLFYSFDKKQWTLNEMIFFAINNLMLISIYDQTQTTLLKVYDYTHGITTTTTTVAPLTGIKYGRLYNWYAAVDTRSIAPTGWHIPTLSEWETLIDYAGGISAAGGSLKEAGSIHWLHSNHVSTDIYSFSALGASYLNNNGIFGDRGWEIDKASYFLTSNIETDGFVSDIRLYYDSEDIDTIWSSSVRSGLSVRLIKDNSTNEGDVIIDGDTYNAVTIGSQVWLQQNLAVKHYQNGDLIGSDFSGTDGAVAAYDNDENNVYY